MARDDGGDSPTLRPTPVDREPGTALNGPQRLPVIRYFSTSSSVKACSSHVPGSLTSCRVFKVLIAYKRRMAQPLTRPERGGIRAFLIDGGLGATSPRLE